MPCILQWSQPLQILDASWYSCVLVPTHPERWKNASVDAAPVGDEGSVGPC